GGEVKKTVRPSDPARPGRRAGCAADQQQSFFTFKLTTISLTHTLSIGCLMPRHSARRCPQAPWLAELVRCERAPAGGRKLR
ncbi:MAG: hypothetical protein AB7N65_03560, partial [Vicinamibacterales bacterium]